MKKLIAVSILISCFSLLSGCASIVDGTSQNVSVETPPVTGAACSLKNDKGSWQIVSTPGSAVVHKSTQPIFIHCQKKGYKTAYQNFQSSTKGIIAGNAVFGGFIGAGIDAADGAAFDYPPTMIVPMKKH
jgi:uncharacterized protein YceK